MMTQQFKNHISSFDELPLTAYVRQRTVEQLFACSAATVWRWVHKGLIPSPHKIGGITLWNVGELREALNAVRGA
ncbi:MAG: helix-turn-helix transcriptional regulator [Alphaproteobacteria bacterium]